MRFQKGRKMEISSKKAVPSAVMASRSTVTPCLPPTDGSESWNAGDVVEVLDDHCWQTATVVKVMRGCHYLVRLIGSGKHLRVHKVNIRVHQLRQNGKRVVAGKGSASLEDCISHKVSTLSCYQTMQSREANAGNNTGFQGSCMVSARTLKRASPFCSSEFEGYDGNTHKKRAIEKEGERQQFMSSYAFKEKLDVISYPQDCLGEMHVHAPPTNQTNAFYEMERGKPYCLLDTFHSRSSECDDSDIVACSVGSCSVVSNSPCKVLNNDLAGNSTDEETTSSTAESFYGCGDEEEKCSLPLGEDVATRIHRLELHAYHCTIGLLYASGPLSWEQEALLTNLRISLNIPNDEHLMELRNLISAGSGIHISLQPIRISFFCSADEITTFCIFITIVRSFRATVWILEASLHCFQGSKADDVGSPPSLGSTMRSRLCI